MNKNVLDFYMKAIGLKDVDRAGWKQVGIEDVESVMSHIGGTILLAATIASEKKLDLDMQKVYEMIAVKELKKLKKEESVINGKEYVDDVKSILPNEYLINIYNEYTAGKTDESKFVLKVSKLESDIQAKKYELDGKLTLENAKADVNYYPEDIKNKVGEISKPSEGWIKFDREYYDDELFNSLSKDIEEI